MPDTNLVETIDTLDARLARRLIEDHPVDAARLLEALDGSRAVDLLVTMKPEDIAAVLSAMQRGLAVTCLTSWPPAQRPQLLDALTPDLAARLLRSLEPAIREEMLLGCPKSVSGPLRRLLRYPEETAGALMDPAPPIASADLTVEQACRLIEDASRRTSGYLFVVARDDLLVGFIEVDDLLCAAPAALLEPLVKPAPARIAARADRSAIAMHPGWRRYHTLPVVDRNDVLIGAIAHRMLHDLEATTASRTADPPLGLALGEMYWTLLSVLVEGVGRSLKTPKAVVAEKEAR